MLLVRFGSLHFAVCFAFGQAPNRRGDLRRIPDQVIRLAIIVAVSVIALIVVRQKFVPATFGEEGHYRSAARDTIAATTSV